MRIRGAGRALFVAILLLVVGTLDIIYGIGAVSNARFVSGTQYVFTNLHTWGWITIIVGVIEVTAAFSLMAGGAFGRVVGIIAGTIGAIDSLLSVGGGAHPWWDLAIFVVCVYCVHGLIILGEPEPVPT